MHVTSIISEIRPHSTKLYLHNIDLKEWVPSEIRENLFTPDNKYMIIIFLFVIPEDTIYSYDGMYMSVDNYIFY